jgi:sRNA-binding protein
LSPYEHFLLGAKYLLEAKLSLPVPLRDALNGTPRPLALGTVDELPGWMRQHGYDMQHHRAALTRALGALTISEEYLRSIDEGVPRMTLDGAIAGSVSADEAAFTTLVRSGSLSTEDAE